MEFTWKRFYQNGYECSSRGDKRFSALFARLPDGRTIEQHYQCDIKGYDIGGTNWKLGKGKKPIREVNLLEEYLQLWKVFAQNNLPLMRELYINASKCNGVLTDMFATTEVN